MPVPEAIIGGKIFSEPIGGEFWAKNELNSKESKRIEK